MKNDRTPRTLADCEFTVGHRQAVERHGRWADRVIGALAVAVVLALLAGWL